MWRESVTEPKDSQPSWCLGKVEPRNLLVKEGIGWYADAHLLELVAQGGSLGDEVQSRVFGEALPKGLRIG